MATVSVPVKPERTNAPTGTAQNRVTWRSPGYWRVTIDNPPINVMGPEMVRQFQRAIDAIEADEHVRAVVFDSAVDGYFLNHSDFTAKLEDLTGMPPGPTGLPPWPDFLVRLTRVPVVPENMLSSGSTTISPKATRKRSYRRITSDGDFTTCREELIGSDATCLQLMYLLM